MATNEEVIVNERSRKYFYFNGNSDGPQWLNFANVVGVRVSESGNHYIRTAVGDLAIVRPTWDTIQIIPETWETGWTF